MIGGAFGTSLMAVDFVYSDVSRKVSFVLTQH